MNDRVKNIAKKLYSAFDAELTMQELYNKLTDYMAKQRAYFNKALVSDDRILLLVYIYSLLKTGDFSLGEKILNKGIFANLFHTDLDPHIINCEYCSGQGNITCQYCHGTGEIYNEDNDDYEICPECDGLGYVACSTCDATGEVDSFNEVDYITYFIFTWNNFLIDRCELVAGGWEPAMSEDTFDDLLAQDEIVILNKDDGYGELVNGVEATQIYCSYYSDEPELYANPGTMSISLNDDDGMEIYFV